MNKSVIDFYFTSIGEDRFKCKCGRIRKQTKGSGFSNLKNHINSSHPTWRTEVSSGVETIISNKAKNIFAWLEWVIMENRELHFPENSLNIHYKDLNWIPPTSNKAERLFSRAKLTLSDCRKSMTPLRVESITFLFVNRDLWNKFTVDKLL